MRTSPWIQRPRPNLSAPRRLFAFPYAGGNARVFLPVAEALGDRFDVCLIEYPGRGARYGEPLLRSVDAFIDGVLPTMAGLLDRPFSLLGYSLGASVAFGLARALRRRALRLPETLIVGARCAPQLVDPRPPTYALPEPLFVKELHRLGGVPPQVLEEPDLLALLLPIARADLEAAQTHIYVEEPPLDIPIVAFAGSHDPLASAAEIDAWSVHSTMPFSKRTFAGGHFFVHTAQTSFVGAVDEVLAR